jgi:hypothetical protein
MKQVQRHSEGPMAGSASYEPGEHRVPSVRHAYGTTALEAVQQATELIRTIEARANETETRARVTVRQAVEDMKLANARVLSVEELRA